MVPLPLERCAELAASLDCRPDDEEAILSAAELSKTDWERAYEHHRAAIAKALQVSDKQPLHHYDDAYYRQIEREREAALSEEDITRLELSIERGTLDEVLRALKLPAAGLIHIQRVWLRKRLAQSLSMESLSSPLP